MNAAAWIGILVVGVAVAAWAGAGVSARRWRRRAAAGGRALAESEAKLLRSAEDARRVRDVVLASLPEGVVLFGPEGASIFQNPSLERLVGVPIRELESLLPMALRDVVRDTRSDGLGHAIEVETGVPSRWLRGTAVPAGEAGGILLVVSDITEARRHDAIRTDFVANASHELKTPAASIQAAAETLRTAIEDDPAVVPRFAAQLERDAIRLSHIVADLLDLSRLETGSDLGERVHVDAVVREEVSRYVEGAREERIEFSVRTEPVPPVRGSARDISLLVRNLVDNAIRHTKPGGRIDVTVGASDGSVRLRVADTGIGIPTRDLPRVFERFYRVDRARSRETGGTGLGLAIVRHVAENHGGDVTVESELGRGSAFTVRLPVPT